MVPLLVLWTGLDQHLANGTSLAAIIPISLAGLAIYYLGSPTPQVDFGFALLLVAGSVIGAYVGARSTAWLPERALRQLMAGLLLAVALKELILP